ncbi:MAG: hypothetical protein FJ253_08955 [Phycisphaerae bacterium]|nr:hypothetical protein [Phycisphaerae bacterium]
MQYEPDTHIVSSGPTNLLLGTLIPVPRDIGSNGGTPAQPADGGLASGCTGMSSISGDDGASPGNIAFTMHGPATIDAGMFLHIDGGHAPEVNASGTQDAPGIQVLGGAGGKGADVFIRVTGPLTINGVLSNAKGGNGGNATAQGHDGVACGECGGNAIAQGGEGGQAGKLEIQAPSIVWIQPPPNPLGNTPVRLLNIKTGGLGGDAHATAGSGGSCLPFTCGDGGDAGDATAKGGKAGDSNSVIIRVTAFISPPAQIFARRFVGHEDGAVGGKSLANAGHGGSGGPCPCFDPGGSGGDAGYSEAKGGDGGAGVGAAGEVVLLQLFAPLSVPLPHSNGGSGGKADAVTGLGGFGYDAADCDCLLNVFAGDGGDGGDGGNASAVGGKGGMASGAHVFSGNGGNGSAVCAQLGGPPFFASSGGKPGKGGSCVGNDPPNCEPGDGGTAGSEATASSLGGEPGDVESGATPGAQGSPQPTDAVVCPPYPDASPGLQDCPKGPPCGDPDDGDCCSPHENPGCDDAACCAIVCKLVPLCCEVAWDELCAGVAGVACPHCAPTTR